MNGDDRMTVGTQVKGCYAQMKGIEATLKQLANKAQHTDSIQAFQSAEQLITEIKLDLQKQVIELTKEEPQYK